MYQVNAKDRPIELTINGSQLPTDWKIATGWSGRGDDVPGQRLRLVCGLPDRDCSHSPRRTLSVLGTTYHFIVHDEMGKQDYTQFTRDMQRVFEKGLVPILAPAVGGPLAAPFPEYWFIIHIAPGDGTGWRHGAFELDQDLVSLASGVTAPRRRTTT